MTQRLLRMRIVAIIMFWEHIDSDIYKWLEAAANSYAISPDETLLKMMDEVISLIEQRKLRMAISVVIIK